MKIPSILGAAFIVAMTMTGCAPQLQNAVQIGDREPATWVFVSVADKSYQGVYRCKETQEGPVCTKAKVVEP
jgi:hypothetical protein